MKFLLLLAAAAPLAGAASPRPPEPAVVVTPDNFPRAESDLYFASAVKDGGLGKFLHRREPIALDRQTVTRVNRDTLYSGAVFDLDAGPVTITLPDAGRRFMSMQAVDEDAYTDEVVYGPGRHTLTKAEIGTRYVLVAVRIFVDAGDPKDVGAVNALQDAIKVEQPGGSGSFHVANWDASTQVDVRTALIVLAETLPDAKGMFGPRGGVDPVRRLIGSGAAWGGIPEEDALYLNVTPPRNDGRTVHKLTLKDVPVDGFWSISVYDSDGRFAPNPQKTYTVNSLTSKTEPDGSAIVQFGGCDGKIANCLLTPPDWSYMIRLYRPRPEILSGAWIFPAAQAIP